jgi:hypothetical protein
MSIPSPRPSNRDGLSLRDIIHLEKLLEAKRRSLDIAEHLHNTPIALDKLTIELAIKYLKLIR